MDHLFLRAGCVAALVFPFRCMQPKNHIAEPKQMPQQMKQDYEMRIGALQARIADAEEKARVAETKADDAEQGAVEANDKAIL